MNQGIQMATSGVLTAIARQNVLTNNLANLNTVGFKPNSVATQLRAPARQEDSLWHLASNDMLEMLGGGAQLRAISVNFDQGPLSATGGELDLAIQGDGFFVVQGSDGPRFTRDGRFSLNNEGTLVLASNGMAVLDDQDRPIRLGDAGTVTIHPDGVITDAAGTELAQLQIADVPNRHELAREGQSLFRPSPAALAAMTGADGRVSQGFVEGSAVNEIKALMQVQAAGKAVSGNVNMIRYQDEMMQRAISTFARIA